MLCAKEGALHNGHPRASHASRLPESGLAEWYQLLPSGVFQGRDGRGPYLLEGPDAEAVAEAFARLGCDLPVDYEHQSLDAAKKSGPVPAAGWIKEVAATQSGLWGRIEWTKPAQNCLEAKEYRYISPVFVHDKAGRVKALTMAALTNTPNLHLQAAASRKEGPMADEFHEKVCALLDIPEESTDAEIIDSLCKLKAEADSEGEGDGTEDAAGVTVEVEVAQMRSSLGLPRNASMAEISQALQSRLNAAPDPAKYVPIDMYLSASGQLSALRQAQAKGHAEALVQAAMSAGKIAPAQKEWAASYAASDPGAFEAFVSAAPVIVAPGAAKPAGAAPAGALTPEQKHVAAAMGIDPALYLKTLQSHKEEQWQH